MTVFSKFAVIGATLGAAAMLAAPAQSQDFNFKGKQIKLTIGYGFGGTGMKSNSRKFEKYGTAFSKGDVIGCYLSCDKHEISFSINGKSCGIAYKLSPKAKLKPTRTQTTLITPKATKL